MCLIASVLRRVSLCAKFAADDAKGGLSKSAKKNAARKAKKAAEASHTSPSTTGTGSSAPAVAATSAAPDAPASTQADAAAQQLAATSLSSRAPAGADSNAVPAAANAAQAHPDGGASTSGAAADDGKTIDAEAEAKRRRLRALRKKMRQVRFASALASVAVRRLRRTHTTRSMLHGDTAAVSCCPMTACTLYARTYLE